MWRDRNVNLLSLLSLVLDDGWLMTMPLQSHLKVQCFVLVFMSYHDSIIVDLFLFVYLQKLVEIWLLV